MKKAFFIIGVSMFALVGCGDDSSTTNSGNTTNQTSTPPEGGGAADRGGERPDGEAPPEGSEERGERPDVFLMSLLTAQSATWYAPVKKITSRYEEENCELIQEESVMEAD
ncbi:MAG: hypothetical protein ATN35_12195 [Epulopiscium sp. Nele67-Bin004]|nr:MAG: hypothetical protein ATN35_12195 [Epulopiscium sp. Nele67-Bin004]